MSCFSPVILYKSLRGQNAETGKWPLKGLKSGGDIKHPVIVPCGRCIECRLERSRQWAVRCVHESQMHDEKCFITLTYSDDHIPCGEKAYTLNPRDLQLFMKRLRKKYGEGIRFFACGEYGDKYGRPHYHACIFGLDFEDKKLYSERDGIRLFDSASLTSLWSLGDCKVGDVTFESAAYVARYIMTKKIGRQARYYEDMGIEPEFTRMSRRPGIGASWYEKFKSDIYPHDYTVIRGGIKTRPPKYYNNKYELDNPQQMEYIKNRRKEMAIKNEHLNTPKILKARQIIKKQKTQLLKRTLQN